MPSQTGSIDLTAQVSANNNAKDYSDDVVDNLVVGGRNLFVNGSASNGYPTDAAVGNTYGVSNMSANHEAYEKIPVEEESSYIVQYWVDDSAHAGWVCIQLLDSSDVIKNKICRTYPAADYWTTTIDIPTGVSQMLVSGRHLASGYAYAKIKVEKGNKATDWTPAPEDQKAFSISSGVEYIEGTQSSATNLWTGVTKESSLVSGKSISYKLPFAGNNSAATLNLTLSDGSTTGAKAVKQIYTTASNTGALADITTHWPVGSVIPMTYDGTRWIVQNYNTNVDHYDRIQHNNTIKSASEKATGKNYAVVSGSLIGYISALSGYQTILGGSVVDISKPLLWGSGNVAASTNFTNAYEIYPSQTVRNNAGSSWTGTTFSMVYLFGTLNGTNLTVDSTVFTSTIPATEDGKVYIPIGILYSAYQIGFRTTSDIYAYKDGEFGKLSLREASAASKTATNYISADANGIKIHMAGNSTTYQHQTSDSTTFYVGGKKRSQVGADGLHVYVDSTEDEVASFGATARIGYVDGFRTVIGPGRINMLDGTKRLIGIAGGKIKMGQYGSFEVTDTGFNGYGRDGGKYVSLAVNGTGMTRHFTAKIDVEDGETFRSYSFPTSPTPTQNLYVAVDGIEQVESTDYTFSEIAPSTFTVDGAYFQEGGYAGTITFPRNVYGPATVTVEYDREVYGYDMRLGLEEYTNFRVDEDEAVFTSKDGSKISFDYHSLQMIDREGMTYFHVSDLRDSSGEATITEEFVGDGSTKSFSFSVTATDTEYTVTVSDGSGGTVAKYTNGIIFNTAPTLDATITVVYYTTSANAKAYTLGIRGDGTLGPMSVAEGYGTIASGIHAHAEGRSSVAGGSVCHAEGYGTTAIDYHTHAEGHGTTANRMAAHAEGWNTTASGNHSHSEGYETTASRQCCHAEGYQTTAGSRYSHAQNKGTIASACEAQTAIGTFNDNISTNAFEIGNGTSDNARSNAATIDWMGNYIGQAMAGIIQMFAGATPPTGWLLCHGQAISRTDYSTLFAAIGTTWGAGDGSTTFNVPDLRGRMPMGAGTGSRLTARTLGDILGAETHDHSGNSGEVTLSAAQSGLPAHTHSFTQPTVKVKYSKAVASGSATNHIDGSSSSSTAAPMEVSGGAVGAVTGGAKNASSAHKHTISSDANIPPAAVVNFIICTGKTS